MLENIIYALVDPRTNRVKYVGKTTNGLARPKLHGVPSHLQKEKNKHKKYWILQLHALGLTYGIKILERVKHAGELAEAEQRWIADCLAQGEKLTNLTPGGEGNTGYRHTPEAKQRMSATRRGKKQPPRSAEWKRLQRLAHLGKTPNHSAEGLFRMGAATRGLPHSKELRLKIAKGHGARPFTDGVGGTHESVRAAARALNLSHTAVRYGLRVGNLVHKKYRFKFIS